VFVPLALSLIARVAVVAWGQRVAAVVGTVVAKPSREGRGTRRLVYEYPGLDRSTK
jgi:hypothetical protein